jgi:hypothetical protein
MAPTATISTIKEKLASVSFIAESKQSIYLLDETRDGEGEDLELKDRDAIAQVQKYSASAATELHLAVLIGLKPHQCTFKTLTRSEGWCKQHSFDKNGALYYIGTGGGSSEYVNPHRSGEILAAMSSVENGCAADRLVAHTHDGKMYNSTTQGGFGGQSLQWMSVDLGAGRSLVPDHYCLRHGNGDGNFRLRSWRLEGSHNGESWALLREHVHDSWLENGQKRKRCRDETSDQAFGVAHWDIHGVEEAYRHFRIVQTGPNSSYNHSLRCAGLELYGKLWAGSS